MTTVRLNDAALRTAFRGALSDGKIDDQEVTRLLDATRDSAGLTTRRRNDLTRVLDRVGDTMEPAARARLRTFLGLPANDPTMTTPPATFAVEDVASVTKLADVVSTFTAEATRRSGLNADQAFLMVSAYGQKLAELGKNADPKEVEKTAAALEAAALNTPAKSFAKKDADFDTRSDLYEAARGLDPNKFDVRNEEVGKIWSTGYWPMAGNGAMDQAGAPTNHLWAKGGVLSKVDALLKARGQDTRAKSLEFERTPALGWLVGESKTGHFIPHSTLRENDAEVTTGIDFDGDGRITPNVKVDFLNGQSFASVWNRSQLVPKATIDGNVVEVDRKKVTDAAGLVSFEFYRKGTQTKLTAAETATAFYATPNGDGKADGTMDVSWWGSCDKVALAGVVFPEPLKDKVSIDGVEFTKLDVLGLLAVIAMSQVSGTEYVGSRYDKKPDVVVTKAGREIHGRFENVSIDDIRLDPTMRRVNGDILTVDNPFANDPDRELKIIDTTGKSHVFKASEVRRIQHEDKTDMDAAEFHKTALSWLADGRPAAMDMDAGKQVWNYSFHGATLKSGVEVDAANRPTVGFNGPVDPTHKVVEYTMDVRFAHMSWPKTYNYWIAYDDKGEAKNSDWKSENPDFLWRPTGFKGWTGPNDRNPFVTPALVKEIYEKFFDQTPAINL